MNSLQLMTILKEATDYDPKYKKKYDDEKGPPVTSKGDEDFRAIHKVETTSEDDFDAASGGKTKKQSRKKFEGGSPDEKLNAVKDTSGKMPGPRAGKRPTDSNQGDWKTPTVKENTTPGISESTSLTSLKSALSSMSKRG